ncbi:MAG: AAA family ATPase [Lachnospiraceae bacterium]|nr:AAA family ATPase [Lachnospiraceae bacterium]
MESIQVRMLQTPPSIEYEGKPIVFSLKKAEALFYYMAVEKNATRTTLANLLWGGQPDETARKNLRNALYTIKKSFGCDPFRSRHKQLLHLNPEVSFEIDTDRLTEGNDPSVYHSAFLYGFSLKDSYEYDEWMNLCRSHCLTEYLNQMEQHFRALPADDVAGREAIFQRYIEAEPLDEKIYQCMIETYRDNKLYLRGIQCYENLVEIIKTEMDLTPSQSLEQLYRELIQAWNRSEAKPTHRHDEPLLAGRTKELTTLRQTFQQLLLHHGSTLFILGEKGSGKSYLCQHFLQELRDSDVLILQTECFESEQNIPLHPWNTLFYQLNRYLQTHPVKIPTRYTRSVESLFPMLETLGSLEELPQDVAGSYNYRAARNSAIKLLSLVGESVPIALYLDNLHCADSLSAEWLSALVRACDENILILCTCPLHLPEKWEKYVNNLVCQRQVRKMILERFTMEDVRDLMTRYTGDPDPSPRLLKKIYTESQGNPFFLSIILDNLETNCQQPDISGRAQDILTARLTALSHDQRKILELISCFHDYVTLELLLAITGMDMLTLLDNVESLKEEDFITEREQKGQIHFLFLYPKMREYVRNTLSPSKARIYHNRIAGYLEQLPSPHKSNWYSQLIYHHRKGGNPAKSLYYQIRQLQAYSQLNYELYPKLRIPVDDDLTDQSQFLLSLEEMKRELSRYYSLYPEQIPYDEAECRLYLTIGRTCIQQGDYEKGLPHIHHILMNNLYVRTNPDLLLSFYRQLVFYGIQTWQLPTMRDALEHCRQIEEGLSSISERAVGKRLWGLYYSMSGDYETSNRFLKEAIDAFERAPLQLSAYTVNLAACYNYLGENQLRQNNYERAIELYQRAIDLCNDREDMENPTFYTNLAQAYIRLKRFRDASETLTRARALYENSPVYMGRTIAYVSSAWLAFRQEETEEAARFLSQAQADTGKLGSPLNEGSLALLSWILKKSGETAFDRLLPLPAEEYLEEAHRELEGLPVTEWTTNSLADTPSL